jgi:hypothetical protein
VAIDESDLDLAATPACLVYAAMMAGNLSRWRGKHIRGNHAYPLTPDAQAYQRAHDLARRLCVALDHRLGGE